MKQLKYIIILGIILTVFSCGKDEPKYSIPAAPVNFLLNTTSWDNHLAAGVGNICVYIRTNDKGEYDKLVAGVKSVKTFNSERAGGSYLVGYSGLLVINTGSTFTPTPYAAFDLCCPNEGIQTIRVLPTDNGVAECPVCKSTFDILNGSGMALSGEAKNQKKNLQSYYISQKSGSEFLIFYQ